MNKIKFIPKYVEPILKGEKTLTIRYNWNSLPERGERVLLQNSYNNITFASATVNWIDQLTLREFVNEKWEGHKEYDSIEEIIWALGHFYDEDELSSETEIDVIGWKNVNSMYETNHEY